MSSTEKDDSQQSPKQGRGIALFLKKTHLLLKRRAPSLKKTIPLLAFIIPIAVLYVLYPGSFEKTWKGRTYYFFFLWLLSLEMILGWDELGTNKLGGLKSPRTLSFLVTLSLPTIYVFVANFAGLNDVIVGWSLQRGMTAGNGWFARTMPLSIEYLVLATIFVIASVIEYGRKGIMKFPISTSLLAIIGAMYLADNIYPNGSSSPLQLIVPTTTRLAASFLSLLGYNTRVITTSDPYLPRLFAQVPGQPAKFAIFDIGWPCAGVESLIIYTVTILLFLRRSSIPKIHKIVYFAIGAAVTYFINILRIATIFIIAINGGDWVTFHDYYGQLYSITWVISYPLIIIGIRALWSRISPHALPTTDAKGTLAKP